MNCLVCGGGKKVVAAYLCAKIAHYTLQQPPGLSGREAHMLGFVALFTGCLIFLPQYLSNI